MARLTAPDEGSRLIYRVDGSLVPVVGALAVFYADAAGTILADIRDINGNPVASTLVVDAYSRLPLFQMPDSVDTVYVSVAGGPLTPVYARTDDRLDTLNTTVATNTAAISAEATARAAADAAALAAANGTYELIQTNLLGRRSRLPKPTDVDKVMATPPTISALATASAIASGVDWPAMSKSITAGTQAVDERFTYYAAGSIQQYGTVSPDRDYVASKSLTSIAAALMPVMVVEFMHEGLTLELKFKGIASYFRIRVDGELVSATPTTLTSTGSTYFLPITFATRAVRKITFETTGVFGGAVIGPNDSLWGTPKRGPRCIVIGDSYTEGTGSGFGAVVGYVRRFAAAMGWGDTWASGVGGTGYVNTGGGGGKVKFRDRLAADVIAYSPDVVVWVGGANDVVGGAASLGSEAALCFAQVAAALPACKQIVVGIIRASGVEGLSTAVLDCEDALAAAAAAAGLPFVSPIAGPTTGTLTTTLSAQASATATTASVPIAIPWRTVLEFGSGATRERRIVTNLAGGGPYTITLNAALTYTHPINEAVRAVGTSFITGTGFVGTPTGSGNADLLISSDAVHFSLEGHTAFGTWLAEKVAERVLAA